MSKSNKAHEAIGTLLELTREEELDCDEFSRHLAAFIEGGTQPRLRALMEHHEKICPECEEERRALLEALELS